MKIRTGFVSVLMAIALTMPAQSATLTYNNEDDFLEAVGDPVLESFESNSSSSPSSRPIVTSFFTASISPITFSSANMQIKTSPQTGTHATDSSHFLLAGGGPVAGDFELTFDFTEPIRSFGFNLNDFGEANTPGALILSTDQGENFTIKEVPEFTRDGEELFFGIVTSSATISSITLSKTNVDDGIGIDEVYFAVVPEPCSFVLAILACVALLQCLRYRRT